VHLLRHSLNFCAWKDRKAVAALDAFEEKWPRKYASVAPAWRRAWQEVIPFFAFDPLFATIDPPDQSLDAPTPQDHLHDERD